MHIDKAQFITSAAKLTQCPAPDYPEFALVGRSNVGKSSLINMLTQRTKLAKVSITPGKTQLLNYFLINETRYLVDLPGYGYAKYSKTQRIEWMDTMQDYLTKRDTLKNIFVLIDGSIPPQKVDVEFLQLLEQEGIHFEIIITKTDKCTQKELHKNITEIQNTMRNFLRTTPQLFQSSSTKGRGRNEILDYIASQCKNTPTE